MSEECVVNIKGLLFDVNGTMSDIQTNEWHDDVYRVVSNLLSYQGVRLAPEALKGLYFEVMKEQRAAGGERYPEFDAIGIFRHILTRHASAFTRGLGPEKLEQLPRLLAETHRAASRFRLQLYPGVEDTIRALSLRYRLGVVSDGQTAYAVPELEAVGLGAYFNPVIVSGDYGYRKPDERLFATALGAMQLSPSEVLFVGNDMYCDVYGAQRAGMKAVFFKSNQGTQEKKGVQPDYVIYRFSEVLDALRFFEAP